MTKWITASVAAALSLVFLMSDLQGQDKGKSKEPEKGQDKAAEKKAEAAAPASDANYFPIKVGTSWEYASGSKRVTVKVAAHEKVADVMCARLETSTDVGVLTEHVAVKSDGVYKLRANGQTIEPPLLMLKLPLKKGDTWSVRSEVQGYVISGKYTVSEEKISIEKIDYTTLCVKSSELVLAGRATVLEDFYAPEIGLVRKSLKIPDGQVDLVLELVKYTPGN
jgi:hypothetical protein